MSEIERACMTAKQLAQMFGVGERQARDWVHTGAVYSFRIGRRIIIPRRAVERMLNGTAPPPTTTDTERQP